MLRLGLRAKFWTDSYNFKEAVMANRGPEYGGEPGMWLLAPGATGQGSLTLPIFGGPNTWEGNVAYNDGRVVFEGRPDPAALNITYPTMINGLRTHGDNMFVNECDDGIGVNPDNEPARGHNVVIRSYSNVRPDSVYGVRVDVMRD